MVLIARDGPPPLSREMMKVSPALIAGKVLNAVFIIDGAAETPGQKGSSIILITLTLIAVDVLCLKLLCPSAASVVTYLIPVRARGKPYI